mmetsp:Transcript_2302/g.5252  ORF Transcript_2302/g.5252 Transcript_2302/m.5252 type:complete len:445 (-) Transcript_2302:427-1761(-)
MSLAAKEQPLLLLRVEHLEVERVPVALLALPLEHLLLLPLGVGAVAPGVVAVVPEADPAELVPAPARVRAAGHVVAPLVLLNPLEAPRARLRALEQPALVLLRILPHLRLQARLLLQRPALLLGHLVDAGDRLPPPGQQGAREGRVGVLPAEPAEGEPAFAVEVGRVAVLRNGEGPPTAGRRAPDEALGTVDIVRVEVPLVLGEEVAGEEPRKDLLGDLHPALVVHAHGVHARLAVPHLPPEVPLPAARAELVPARQRERLAHRGVRVADRAEHLGVGVRRLLLQLRLDVLHDQPGQFADLPLVGPPRCVERIAVPAEVAQRRRGLGDREPELLGDLHHALRLLALEVHRVEDLRLELVREPREPRVVHPRDLGVDERLQGLELRRRHRDPVADVHFRVAAAGALPVPLAVPPLPRPPDGAEELDLPTLRQCRLVLFREVRRRP